MDFEIKICFNKNSSKYYERAMQIAHDLPGFKEGKPNTVTLDAESLAANITKIYELCRIIDRWSKSELWLNNERTTRWELERQIAPLQCYSSYQKTVIQEIYCWNYRDKQGWGCKQLEAIKRHYYPDSPYELGKDILYWFEVGNFVDANDNLWRIDKKQITKLLKREAELKRLNLCPIFNFDRVVAAVNQMPEEINVAESNQWEIEYSNELGYEPVAIKIRPKEPTIDKWLENEIDKWLENEEDQF